MSTEAFVLTAMNGAFFVGVAFLYLNGVRATRIQMDRSSEILEQAQRIGFEMADAERELCARLCDRKAGECRAKGQVDAATVCADIAKEVRDPMVWLRGSSDGCV